MSKYHGKYLHVVSFDIPFPPNYGGIIDVYYKIKALSELGVKIILHCFEYGRTPAPELSTLCHRIHYYKRNVGRRLLFVKNPYIVAGRNSQELSNILLQDTHPILLEGLHTCSVLENSKFRNRQIFVRAHNVEHHYYEGLAKAEKNIFKRYYYLNEAAKLKKFEKILSKATGIIPICKSENEYFKKKYQNVKMISAFHPLQSVKIKQELSTFACYHGSLNVAENNMAALFLVEKVFNKSKHKLVIAGNYPSKELREAVNASANVKIVSDIDSKAIQSLVESAQVNILPTFQATGLKLKLLMALFVGKHCLVNNPMVENTGLESLCEIANTPEEFRTKLDQLMEISFSEQQIAQRKNILESQFSNKKQAEDLCGFIFGVEN